MTCSNPVRTLVGMSNRYQKRRLAADPEVYVSVTRAATIVGVSRQTIHARITRGEIQTENIAGRRVVVRASLDKAAA